MATYRQIAEYLIHIIWDEGMGCEAQNHIGVMTAYNEDDLLPFFGGETFLRKCEGKIKENGTKCFYIYASYPDDNKFFIQTIGYIFGDYYMIKVKDEDTKIAVFPIEPEIIVSYKA